MTCEQFQLNFNRMLDGMLPSGEVPKVLAHRASCAACSEYAAGIERVDRLLREQGPVEVSDALLTKLYAIQTLPRPDAPSVSWQPYVRKALRFVAVGTAAFLLASLLPVLLQAATHGVIIFAASTLMLVRSWEPAFVSREIPIPS